jgi:hypothetical protein
MFSFGGSIGVLEGGGWEGVFALLLMSMRAGGRIKEEVDLRLLLSIQINFLFYLDYCKLKG